MCTDVYVLIIEVYFVSLADLEKVEGSDIFEKEDGKELKVSPTEGSQKSVKYVEFDKSVKQNAYKIENALFNLYLVSFANEASMISLNFLEY